MRGCMSDGRAGEQPIALAAVRRGVPLVGASGTGDWRAVVSVHKHVRQFFPALSIFSSDFPAPFPGSTCPAAGATLTVGTTHTHARTRASS